MKTRTVELYVDLCEDWHLAPKPGVYGTSMPYETIYPECLRVKIVVNLPEHPKVIPVHATVVGRVAGVVGGHSAQISTSPQPSPHAAHAEREKKPELDACNSKPETVDTEAPGNIDR